jgi:hypothetical protein
MNEGEEREHSYELGSSEEIVVECCQEEKDLLGTVIQNHKTMTGEFGNAELLFNRGDRVVVLNTATLKVKLIDRVYRSIILKRNKKKESSVPVP